jgi:hypothetical protein
MRKIYFALMAAAVALTSCEEWDQVFTLDYGEADVYEQVTMTPNTSIADLKALYQKSPVKIDKDIIIGGQVVSEDKSGNIYKSLYIQDETGGIELKIGKSALYNDYKLGQWVYVKCSGLTLGAYNGMLQLGYADPSGEYETSYLDVQYIIDTHVFRGKVDTPVAAKKVAAADLLKQENIGCYVELDGLTYANEIFCLVYVDQNGDKKSNDNRIFFSDETYGVTTWAMSKQGFLSYLESGALDSGATNTGKTVPELKATLKKNASAYAVSQYFKMGGREVQIRTSGYARFADTQIDPEILAGAKINVKGILTIYNNAAQFTLIDVTGVEKAN